MLGDRDGTFVNGTAIRIAMGEVAFIGRDKKRLCATFVCVNIANNNKSHRREIGRRDGPIRPDPDSYLDPLPIASYFLHW